MYLFPCIFSLAEGRWQDATTLLAVYDGSNTLIQRFEYADGRMPVAMTASGQMYYLTYDQVGSLRAIFDSAGNEVKRIDYDSFGNILSDSNLSFTVPFGFAGGLHDRDTGLVRFGARDYDPATGKWTAKDPIDFGGGDLNLLNYCLGDPVNWVDSFGLDVRLESTDSVFGFHQRIVVDIPPDVDLKMNGMKIEGSFGISFGLPDLTTPQQPCDEAKDVRPSFGGPGSGVVYPDLAPRRYVIAELATSNEEDLIILQYLTSQVGKTGPYNWRCNSCRDYSVTELYEILDLIQDIRSTKRNSK